MYTDWVKTTALLQERFKHRGMTEFFTNIGERIEYIEMYWFVDLYDRWHKSPPHAPGVYMWFNVGKRIGYVGSSKDLFRRRADFLNFANKYGCDELCRDRDECPEDFVFLILEYVDDPCVLKTREQHYISKYRTIMEGYNINNSRAIEKPAVNLLEGVDVPKGRSVVHLHLLESDEHHYYGSLASIFDYYDADALGVTYGTLKNYGLCNGRPFCNERCVIRKGVILAKKGNRGTHIRKLLVNHF